MATQKDLIAHAKRLAEALEKRAKRHKLLERYIEGNCPYPPAVTEARLTNLYRHLMPISEAPFPAVVVGSKRDRLELTGFRDPVDQKVADRIWADAWQPNWMDSESKLAHDAALLDGRCYATVWPDENDRPDIALDDCSQMIVEFAEGSRRKRVAALRRWSISDEETHATLYRLDGIYKFEEKGGQWKKRIVDGESWPIANPFASINALPVVELRVNGRLKPGKFPYARGEFEHCLGLIDRINLLTFLGLVVAFWQGFPLRGVIGEKARRRVLVDDDGDPLIDEATGKEKTVVDPPFDLRPDSIFQLENPEAKIVEYQAADRSNLSVFQELDQLAVITSTPRHYFPMPNGMSNLSAEAIMASEGGMHAGVTGHKATLGDGWEEVARLAGYILDLELSQRASAQWADHQSRSLAERADAASKLKDVVPPEAVAEIALGASSEQIARWQSLGAANPLAQLVAAASQPNGIGAG
jgi:hypothetical protein